MAFREAAEEYSIEFSVGEDFGAHSASGSVPVVMHVATRREVFH